MVTLDDNVLKHFNDWEMPKKKVNSDCKIFVKHISGAATNCTEDYMKLSLRKDASHIILHVGTNDPILYRTSQDIGTSIVNLSCSMKGEIVMSVYQTSS